MSKHPLITVITSTLNAGDALRETIESISTCTYPAIEYIVVDGGSVDNTMDVILDAGSLISAVISEPDDGIYSAWNKGLKLAHGEYIAFLGAGDVFVKEGISMLVECAMANQSADLVTSKVAIVREGIVQRIVGSAWKWNVFRRYMNVAHPGSLHSQRLFHRYGPFNPSFRVAGDYELLLRAGKHLKAVYLDMVTVRMVAGGASQDGSRVFHESEAAKIRHQSVPPLVARFDRYIAQLKRWVRGKTIG